MATVKPTFIATSPCTDGSGSIGVGGVVVVSSVKVVTALCSINGSIQLLHLFRYASDYSSFVTKSQ